MKRIPMLLAVVILALAILPFSPTVAHSSSPVPLLEKGQPVDWWFVFKLNAATFPECGDAQRSCPFGGTVQNYKGGFSQQFIYASSINPTLQKGSACIGDTSTDPVGATFDQVYNGSYFYVVWNDQFYNDPVKSQGSPWGHTKGMLAWGADGNGFVMQVSTPSWPGSGSKSSPRKDGNTLGCVTDDNVKVSQHFFALKLNKDDLVKVLTALRNASAVTDPAIRQIVNNGGPSDVQALVASLGKKSSSKTRTRLALSSGVDVISKPSGLAVPPWQMVSATLGSVPLRAATWWATPMIGTTARASAPGCWDSCLGTPGPVEIATTGQWNGTTIGLKGGPQADANHAKIGVSTDPDHPYVIFGDLNQQGALSGTCTSSQNCRGGVFYVLRNEPLFDSMTNLLKGQTVPSVD
jgi:hypothetical protein